MKPPPEIQGTSLTLIVFASGAAAIMASRARRISSNWLVVRVRLWSSST